MTSAKPPKRPLSLAHLGEHLGVALAEENVDHLKSLIGSALQHRSGKNPRLPRNLPGVALFALRHGHQDLARQALMLWFGLDPASGQPLKIGAHTLKKDLFGPYVLDLLTQPDAPLIYQNLRALFPSNIILAMAMVKDITERSHRDHQAKLLATVVDDMVETVNAELSKSNAPKVNLYYQSDFIAPLNEGLCTQHQHVAFGEERLASFLSRLHPNFKHMMAEITLFNSIGQVQFGILSRNISSDPNFEWMPGVQDLEQIFVPDRLVLPDLWFPLANPQSLFNALNLGHPQKNLLLTAFFFLGQRAWSDDVLLSLAKSLPAQTPLHVFGPRLSTLVSKSLLGEEVAPNLARAPSAAKPKM